jgi:hypothetical protein
LQQLQSQRRIVIPRTKCVQPKEISIRDRGHTVHRYLLEAKAKDAIKLSFTKASPGSLVASANICASRSNNFQKYVVHMKPVIVFFKKRTKLAEKWQLDESDVIKHLVRSPRVMSSWLRKPSMDPNTYLIAKAVPEIDTLIPPKKKKLSLNNNKPIVHKGLAKDLPRTSCLQGPHAKADLVLSWKHPRGMNSQSWNHGREVKSYHPTFSYF